MPFDVGSAVGYLTLDTTKFTQGLKSAGQKLDKFNSSISKKLDSVGTSISKVGSTLTTTVTKFASNISNNLDSVSKKLDSVGTSISKVGSTLTTTVTLPLLSAGGVAVKTAATFESSMSQVQATMGATTDSVSSLGGQTVNTMNSLSTLAQKMGSETKFSAAEAAAAINNMAMAGYSVQQIYDSLPQVLSLASAGAIDLDYATQLVANGLNVMGLETSDATELADKLAVTSTKAYGSVSDFGEGLLVAGAQAKLANVSLTDTMTALGILGDNGISASEGGTYLRNTLKNLYTPTDKAADALSALGIKTATADGTLKDFQTVLQELGVALDGLTEDERVKAMSNIFDSRTISAANALIKNSGERWDELSESIDGAAGSAKKMADTQLDNLEGQLTILKSSLEGLAIAFGSLILPVVKKATGLIQRVVDYLNSLDDAQREQILKIAAIVAAVGPVLIVVGKAIKLLGTLGQTIAFLAANPAALIIAAIAALVAGFIYLWKNCEGFRKFFINLWETLKSTVASVANWFVTTWRTVSTFFISLWTGIKTFVSDVWNEITGFFAGAWDAIVSVWSTVSTWFSDNVIEPVKAVFTPLLDWFSNLFTSLWESVKSIFTVIAGLAEGCVNIILRVWEIVSGWFDSNVIQPLSKFFTGLWNTIKDAASAAWNGIKGVWNAVSSWFNSKIIQPISNFFTGMWDGLKSGASAAWEGIKSVFGGVADWFKNIFSKAWQKVKDVFSTGGKIFAGIKEGIVSAFKSVVNAIIKAINKVVSIPFNSINGILNKISGINILGIQPFSGLWSQDPLKVPQIPLLASGGVLKKGQIGLLEGSGAEAVVPLENNLGWIKRTASELYGSLYELFTSSGLLSSIESVADALSKTQGDKVEQTNSKTEVHNEFNFYSPQAIDPIAARKLLRQTAQQLALN